MFWNLLLAVIGCLLVVVVEPAAAGSGIDHVILHSAHRELPLSFLPQVITYLNGIHVPNLFRMRRAPPLPTPLDFFNSLILIFRTVFVKLFGTMVTVSSCLFSGPEGPMILIGSSVASAFTRGLKIVTCFSGKFVIGTNLMSRFVPSITAAE